MPDFTPRALEDRDDPAWQRELDKAYGADEYLADMGFPCPNCGARTRVFPCPLCGEGTTC